MQGQPIAFGRYEVRAEIGAGGFATVYRAHDPVLERAVALKVLHPHLARDPALRERFIREGRALARVRHPNIVQIFDAGEANGVAYLAMDLVEGRSLAALLEERGPASLDQAVAVAVQIGQALHAVHARGLVHRDVKPANILIETETNRAVLLDLGIARSTDAATVTGAGLLMGTPGFMAPEQIDSDQPVSAQTDVYQLGATLYTMLAGRPPFEGETTRVLYAIVHRAPADLGELRPDLPSPVLAVIAESLAKDPARRPAGAAELAAQFRAAAAGRAIPATPGPGPQPLDSASEATTRAAIAQAGTGPARAAPDGRRRDDAAAAAPSFGGGRRASRFWRRPAIILAAVGAAGALAVGVTSLIVARGDGGDDQQARASTVTVAPRRAASPTPAARTPTPATVSPSPTVAPRSPTPTATMTRAPTSTPAPTATLTPSPPAGDTAARVVLLLKETMERRRYTPDGGIVRVRAAESGGVLAIQKGVCSDSANGRCQLLFIFLDERFLGTDTLDPSQGISEVKGLGTGRFSATYANYARNDPGCCPSLPPVTITYTWDGTRLIPSGTPPGH